MARHSPGQLRLIDDAVRSLENRSTFLKITSRSADTGRPATRLERQQGPPSLRRSRLQRNGGVNFMSQTGFECPVWRHRLQRSNECPAGASRCCVSNHPEGQRRQSPRSSRLVMSLWMSGSGLSHLALATELSGGLNLGNSYSRSSLASASAVSAAFLPRELPPLEFRLARVTTDPNQGETHARYPSRSQ